MGFAAMAWRWNQVWLCAGAGSNCGVANNAKQKLLSSSLVILFGCGTGLEVFQMPQHRQAAAVVPNFRPFNQ